MKNRNSSLITFSLLLLIVLTGFSACSKDSPTTPTPPAAQSGFITGTVYAQGRTILSGVTVSVGTITSTTDAYGMYMLNNVAVGANVQVEFEKAGLITLQKTVNVENGKTSNVSCTMFAAVVANIPGVAGGTLSDGLADVVIPSNAFVDESGNAFIGTVKTEMKYFDPTDPECLEAFPGSFTGTLNGVSTDFESYGFIAASFFDAAKVNSKLTLDPLKPATLRVPIPTSLQNNPPLSMPLWYYDEAAGTWIADGTANKVGNFYEGTVTHFTYWNFDHPIIISDQSILTGKVVMSDADNTPVNGAQVVATGVNYAGYTRVYSDAQGNFSISVKAISTVKVRAYMGQNSSPANSDPITTPAGGTTQAIANVVITDESYYITGKLVGADSTPIPNSFGSILNATTNVSITTFMTDASGNFRSQIYPAKGLINIKFSVSYQSTQLSSVSIPFNEPLVGQVYSIIAPIVMIDRGYTLTGTILDANSLPLANEYGNIILSGSGGMYGSYQTDANGEFSTRINNPSSDPQVSVRFTYGYHESALYSPALLYTQPQPGGTYNFPNNIILGAGGTITGIAKDGNGAILTGGELMFVGSESAGTQGMFAFLDENGRFSLTYVPNSVLTGMRAQLYGGEGSYQSNVLTLTFPGAGATTDIGVLTLILQPTTVKK